MGTAITPAHFNESSYVKVVAKEYDLVTAENECKWSATEPAQNTFTFDSCDAVLNFAQENSMAFRGHNLCWGDYNPAWLDALTAQGKREALENHINATLAHYQTADGESLAVAWDVVNEALDDAATGSNWFYKNSTWYPDVPNFVSVAFQAARRACPSCRLFYNDYNIASTFGSDAPKATAVQSMVKELLENGVPIDGVGFQLHVSREFSAAEVDGVRDNIAAFGALGLEVHMTEIDVSCGNWPNYTCREWGEDEMEEQAEVYAGLLAACLDAPDVCTSFESWGCTDKYSWLTAVYGEDEHPLPFDEDYSKKPAYFALLNTLNKDGGPGLLAAGNETGDRDRSQAGGCHSTKRCR